MTTEIAEEMALEMFRREVRLARTFRERDRTASMSGNWFAAAQHGTAWYLHRRYVSDFARIVRAIRAERDAVRRETLRGIGAACTFSKAAYSARASESGNEFLRGMAEGFGKVRDAAMKAAKEVGR